MQEYWNYKYRDVKNGFGDHHIDHLNKDVYPNATSVYQNIVFHSYPIRIVNEVEALTPIQLRWNSYLSIACMVPNLAILMLNVYHGHKISVRPKLLISFAAIVLCFIVTSVMAKVNTDGFQNGFLCLTLITVVLITTFSGILQVSSKNEMIIFDIFPKYFFILV